jgi:hypothetical protein
MEALAPKIVGFRPSTHNNKEEALEGDFSAKFRLSTDVYTKVTYAHLGPCLSKEL